MEEVFAFPWGWGAKKDGGTAFSVFCPRENLVESHKKNEGIFFSDQSAASGTEFEHFWNWFDKNERPGALPLLK